MQRIDSRNRLALIAPTVSLRRIVQVRTFDDQSQVKKVAIMARVAQCIHELCVKVCSPSLNARSLRQFTSV
jgi:hypothetical protein